MPRRLRHDHEFVRAKGRGQFSVISQEKDGRAAFEDHHDLVSGWMPFPLTAPCPMPDENRASR